MGAEPLGVGYFFPEAPTRPPKPAPDEYLRVQTEALFAWEYLLSQIVEHRDHEALQKLIEIVQDTIAHALWCLAEEGRRYQLVCERCPLPGEPGGD